MPIARRRRRDRGRRDSGRARRRPRTPRRRARPAGARGPRRELDRPRDQAVAAALPAPVELGLGVPRDRVRAVRPGARRAGAALALPRPVAQRPAAAHRLHRRARATSRAGVLADRSLARRAAAAADVRNRPAADPRHGGAARLPASARDRDRAAAFARAMLPEARGLARLPLPRADARRDGLAEVWHPWETGMDNSPLWDAPLARIALAPEDVPEYRRVDTELTEPSQRPTNADYDRYAYLVGRLPRARATTRARFARRRRSSSRPSSSTRSSSSRIAISPSSRASSAAIPRRTRTRAEQTAAAMNARLVGRRVGALRRLRRSCRRADHDADGRLASRRSTPACRAASGRSG